MRYHHRFDSNVWVWPKVGKVVNYSSLQLRDELDTTDTATPWVMVYLDPRGGISAATWVMDNSPPHNANTFAFYNTRLLAGNNHDSQSLSSLFTHLEGVPFSPREESLATLWTTLTEVVSPSYESLNDIEQIINTHTKDSGNHLTSTLLYTATHFIPNSINKLHIGG